MNVKYIKHCFSHFYNWDLTDNEALFILTYWLHNCTKEDNQDVLYQAGKTLLHYRRIVGLK